jgi:pyridoxine 5'-phosphate synthase PdxJ
LIISSTSGWLAALRLEPLGQDLEHAAQPGKRVAHFMGHDGHHLTQTRQGRLVDQLFLHHLSGGDVVADRQILVGLSALVQERHDVVSTQ